MERRDRQTVATFFSEESFAAGRSVSLGEGEAHHARVRRIAVGERVRVVDGAGSAGEGVLTRIARRQAVVHVEEVATFDPLPELHLMLPVADRERMLLLAEKAAELGVTSWRPILWKRSRSVTPRGEGVAFQSRVRARMISALTQSGSVWLPAHHPDAPPERAVMALPDGARLLMDRGGAAVPFVTLTAPVIIAVGPEGGLDDSERQTLIDAGFMPVSAGPMTLRFETAALVGVGIARAALARREVTSG